MAAEPLRSAAYRSGCLERADRLVAAEPLRSSPSASPGTDQAWSVRRTAAMLTDRVVLNNALVKWQPNRCAACPAQANGPTAREVAAGPLRSLPITSTLTHQPPPMYAGQCPVVLGPIGSVFARNTDWGNYFGFQQEQRRRQPALSPMMTSRSLALAH